MHVRPDPDQRRDEGSRQETGRPARGARGGKPVAGRSGGRRVAGRGQWVGKDGAASCARGCGRLRSGGAGCGAHLPELVSGHPRETVTSAPSRSVADAGRTQRAGPMRSVCRRPSSMSVPPVFYEPSSRARNGIVSACISLHSVFEFANLPRKSLAPSRGTAFIHRMPTTHSDLSGSSEFAPERGALSPACESGCQEQCTSKSRIMYARVITTPHPT